MHTRLMRLLALPLAATMFLATSPAGAQKTETPEPYNRDAVVNSQIRSELNELPYVGVFDWFEWTYEKGEVRLDGSVFRPSTKQSAERVVKNVQGVDSVMNNIEVQPASPADDRIRMQVYRAVYGQSGLERYALQANPPIRIIVDSGNVTLEGAVASKVDRTVAYTQARSVPGVFKVENHLRIDASGN